MGAQEQDLRSEPPVRQGDVRAGGHGGGGCHPRHDFKIYSCSSERGNLLARAAENQRIASLEPNHSLCCSGIADKKAVYLLLGNRFCAATLSHVTQNRAGRDDAQNFRRNERIVQNDLRRAQDAPGLARQELRIAGPCTDEIDSAPICLWGRSLPRLELRKSAFT